MTNQITVINANKPEFKPYIQQVLEQTIGSGEAAEQPGIAWFLLAKDDAPIGLVYAKALSDIRVFIDILVVPEYEKAPGRKEAVETVLHAIVTASPTPRKIEALVVDGDKLKMRLLSKLGFKREGVCKNSLVVGNTIVDQTYMGVLL